MNGDKLSAIWESRFNLNIVDHFSDAVHDLIAFQHSRAISHEIRNASAIPSTFDDKIANEGNGLRIVKFNAAR